MVTETSTTKIQNTTNKGLKKQVIDPGDPNYFDNIYNRPYSMTNSVFDTFCETQISNNSHYLPNLINFDSLNATTAPKKCNDIINSQENNPYLHNSSIDLTCKEVMPIEESPESTNYPTQDLNTTCDYDSDDSVRDKDYNPSESDISSDDCIGEVKRKKFRDLQKYKKTDLAPESSPPICNMVSDIANKKNLQKNRRGSFDIRRIVQPMQNLTRRNTIDVVPTYDTSHNLEKEPPLQRKRQKYNTSVLQRKIDAQNKKRLEHLVQPGCNEKCLKKCTTQVSQEDREEINSNYWKMNFVDQHLFVNTHTAVAVPKRKITTDPKRKPRRTFYLKKVDGTKVEVCKTFFLTTLGYVKTNDRILQDERIDTTCDKRGKHNKTPAFNRDMLNHHVELFNPMEPHYRREHAPLRRYLPSDLNIVHMHKDFLQKHPDQNISYELYRKHLKKMNISFTRLGNEECEVCETYNLHKIGTSHDQTDGCGVCMDWIMHHEKYLKARQLYENHKKMPQDHNTIYFSADLEKVIMLPRLESFKAAIFCQRLVAYNHTFAPLGKITSESKPLTVLWHDAEAGRKQEDIMTGFYYFLLRNRDIPNIHIWLDNCTAQNKNWLLYSLLVHMVNGSDISAEQIILHYFEPGHTFMSADQVHHQVELAMKKKTKLYDFPDFEEAVASINNGKVNVKCLVAENFLNVPNYVSDRRIQNSNPRAYLKNMTQVCFSRNNYDLMYKNNFEDEYTLLRFMSDKYIKNPKVLKLEFRTNPKGIDVQKKAGIIEKLSSIIPPHKLVFWKNLPTTQPNVEASTSGAKNNKKVN